MGTSEGQMQGQPFSGTAMPGESVRDCPPLSREVQKERCLAAAAEMKEFLLTAPQTVDTQRLVYLLEAYKEFDSEPTIVLRAQFFAKLLHNKTIFIDQNPLVGTVTGQHAGVYVYPEWDSQWILKEMNQAMMSHLGEVNISPEEQKLMTEAAKFFKTRSATCKARALSRQMHDYDPADDIKAGLFWDGTTVTVGSGNVDYATFIDKGLAAVIAEVEAKLRSLPVTVETSSRIDFYRASLIAMRALVHLAHRYAALAESLAARETDPVRAAELAEIAAVCRHVPEHPPRNFRESLQAWWFLHLGIQIEQAGCGSSPGRLGQFLEPYYQKDKRDNGLTREQAIAWLKCLFVKILEFGYYQGLSYARIVSGHTGHTISLGGLDAAGMDATAELDYLLLDTQIDMRNIQPTLTVLYHDRLKEDFLLKAVELERTGLGQPQWLNNRVVMERLLTRHAACGITLKDARNCANLSCVGTGVAGKTAFIREVGTFNLAKMVELALNDGFDPMTEKHVGAATGDPEAMAAFEDFYAAFEAQIGHLFRKARPYGSISNKALGDTVPGPLRSTMYGGCLESGRHEYEGGPRYYLYYSISTAGIDAANALAAVKHLVYDTKALTMARLRQALAADFQGFEEIRQLCLGAPKHGNGDPDVDRLVRRVYDSSMNRYQASGESFYGKHMANIEAYSLSIHNYFGMLTGALPSGRRKGTPLTDGSVSATPGTDKQGPMALIGSAAKALDTVRYGSNHFNMKFHPASVAGMAGARKLLSLIKAYMDMDGSHIQFNVVGSDTLRAAQAQPEDHKGLTVRVAGFSAYYTRLHKGVQDEIIARTEHAM
ncbi:glycyl radical protein [Solidesulfovibrio sp.]|uniref:glycyl radical protein n=1 Tax=Solidesulfovibrio sp. TaxID=2910990 RepID=UPI002B1F7216|nr:pyruvate formate lyase family protein [Solidesulfovibrio sp.]MEA4858180.1 pyruvate formate lyase family protein [Solidesulfovibrio sp.]